MIYVFRLSSPALPSGAPASDLDGEEWTFQDTSLASATRRALRRLDQTFAYAARVRVEASTIAFVAEYPSMAAYDRAQVAA